MNWKVKYNQLVESIVWLIACLWVIFAIQNARGEDVSLVEAFGPPTVTNVTVEMYSEKAAPKALLDDISADMHAARMKLLSCEYFQERYPIEWTHLYFFGAFSIRALPDSDSPYLGLGFSAPKKIVIFGYAVTSPQLRFDVLAHEILHLVDLPKHKEYATEEEYRMKDPIEQVTFWCIRELQPSETR